MLVWLPACLEWVWTNTQQGAKEIQKIDVLSANISKYAISHTCTSYKHTTIQLFWESFNKPAPFHTSWHLSLFFIERTPIDSWKNVYNRCQWKLFVSMLFFPVYWKCRQVYGSPFFFLRFENLNRLSFHPILTYTNPFKRRRVVKSFPAFFVNFSHVYVLHTNSYQLPLLVPTNANAICTDTRFHVLTLSKSVTWQDIR